MADMTAYVTGVAKTGTSGVDGVTYPNLQTAIADEVAAQPSFTTRDGLLNIEISWTGEDTTAAAVAGFTGTTAARYVNIYTTAAARNTGGPWDATKYRLIRAVASSRPLTITTSYTRVTGLQIASTNTTGGTNPIIIATNATDILIDSCRAYINTTANSVNTAVLYLATGTTNTATARNCVFYGGTYGSGIMVGTPSTLTLQNCTVVVPSGAYAIYVAGVCSAYNCYLGGPADTIYGTLTTASKVATSDASGSEGPLQQIAALSSSGAYFTNVLSGSEDFTISVSSALKNVGSTIGTFTVDLAGATRDSVWDIGAFEYVSSNQFGRPSLFVATGNWTNELGTATDLRESINETAALLNDADYIRSGVAPVADTCITELAGITNPGTGTVTMRIRARTI